MEKIEVFRTEYRSHYEWRFTETERNEIRYILRDQASQGDIRDFISLLQGLCVTKKALLEQPSRSDVRLTRERILTDCKAVLGHLKQYETTWYDETIDPLWGHQPHEKKICPECKHPFTGLAWREKCVQCDPTAKAPHKKEERCFLGQYLDSAWAAAGPLEKFVKVLEKYHLAESKKIGHPKADADHFIRKIRDVYIEHISKPTAYEAGAFFTIVKMVLEMLDLPCADPSRAIKAALKSK